MIMINILYVDIFFKFLYNCIMFVSTNISILFKLYWLLHQLFLHMLSKALIKFITSLHNKKHRYQNKMFIAEGCKIVHDFLKHGLRAEYIVATPKWLSDNAIDRTVTAIECDEKELRKCSALSTPTEVLGVFHFPDNEPDDIASSLSILLDDIQDPGNLGTIIRTAEWFGIKNIFCSIGTVDVYNPKVIQATMGAIIGVSIQYCNLAELINKFSCKSFPIYGTFMDGNNIYSSNLSPKGFIVMGNEGKGISNATQKLITTKITIPSYNGNKTISESLNVAIATSIICSEFQRNNLKQ